MADLSGTLDEVVRKTISAVETIAPKAWELLVQEQRISAAVSLGQYLTSTLVFGGVLVVTWRLTAGESFNSNSYGPKPERWVPRGFALGAMAITLIAVSVGTPEAIARYLNPEPFAARALISGTAQ